MNHHFFQRTDTQNKKIVEIFRQFCPKLQVIKQLNFQDSPEFF